MAKAKTKKTTPPKMRIDGTVEIPEWSITRGKVSDLGDESIDRLISYLKANPDVLAMPHSLHCGFIVLALADSNGVPLFALSDIPQLAKKNKLVVQRVLADILVVVSSKKFEDAQTALFPQKTK